MPAARGYFRDWLVVGGVWAWAFCSRPGCWPWRAIAGAAAVYAAVASQHNWGGRRRAYCQRGGVLVPVALLAGWWLVRNQQLYGDWTGNASITALWGP